MSKSIKLKLVAAFLLAVSSVSWGNTVWIQSKAVLAQYLIEDAWQKSLQSGKTHYPWAWADTWPVARMTFPKHDKNLFVLSGSHGTSLAFGPGHLDGTASPNTSGTQVYSGHRDTHFDFLEDVSAGDEFSIQSRNGNWSTYYVEDFVVVNIEDGPWLIETKIDEVQLITCYPVSGINPNPNERLVVIARPSEESNLPQLTATYSF